MFDHIKFGFLLSILTDRTIKSNAQDNHSLAKASPDDVSQFIQEEWKHNAYLVPLMKYSFHLSPLMNRPKGTGRHIILDLSYGEFSLNNATDKN